MGINLTFQLKLNGNMPAGREQLPPISGATPAMQQKQIMMGTIRAERAVKAHILKGLPLSAVMHQMIGTFMICMGMYGSGVEIGMVVMMEMR